MQYKHGAEAAAATAKIANIENINVRFCSRRAVAEWHDTVLQNSFPLHGVIRAAAARPSQCKVGVFCIPAIYFFVLGYIGLLSTATKVSKMSATVMKDNYK